MYIEGSRLNMDGVVISGNDDYGIKAITTELNISKCVLTDNEGSGIVTTYSYGIISESVIGGNQGYGVSMISGPLDVRDSNDFSHDNGLGRVQLEWELSVYVTDTYGAKVSQAALKFQGNGTQILMNTTYSGVAFESVPEYLVDNSGSLIQYNPYTITASKVASWDDVEYSNSTTLSILKDIGLDIMIPMVSPDLEVKALELPKDVSVGKDNQITVTIRNIGDAAANDVEVTVSEKDSEGGKRIVERTTISLAADESTDLTISWKPKIAGESTIEVSLTTGYDELSTDNNRMEITVDVGEKEPELFEGVYVLGFVVAFLVIIAGVAIYSLLLLRKKEEKS
jgi:hypothetical protein